MTSNKEIIGLQKQNDGMYSSLASRNIPFERTVIPEGGGEEKHLKMLQEENSKLKQVINDNKPPPQPKQEKKKTGVQALKEKMKIMVMKKLMKSLLKSLILLLIWKNLKERFLMEII